MAHSQVGEEATDLVASKIGRGVAADESLKFSDPEAVGLQGPTGVVAEANRRLKIAVLLLPGSAPSRRQRVGGG